jgi:hypothetical protein
MLSMKRMALLALIAVTSACATAAGKAAAAAQPETAVVVDNRAVLDMTIYVLRSSQRVRLGLATGLTKTRFRIPQGLVNGSTVLRFMADPIGSTRAPISEEINVSEGEEIGLMIPPN